MKRNAKFKVNSIDAVKKIIANNYKDYSISSTSRMKYDFGNNKERVYNIHLKYKDDWFSSLYIFFNPNNNVMEVIKRLNGNDARMRRRINEIM